MTLSRAMFAGGAYDDERDAAAEPDAVCRSDDQDGAGGAPENDDGLLPERCSNES